MRYISGFPIVEDHRGVSAEQQQAFTDFIETLSQRLKAKSKSLVVSVPDVSVAAWPPTTTLTLRKSCG